MDRFALLGTMSYEKGRYAFFDGSSACREQRRERHQRVLVEERLEAPVPEGEAPGLDGVRDVARRKLAHLGPGRELLRQPKRGWRLRWVCEVVLLATCRARGPR